jgi:K+/H+ antiporter YhaU regulatory subunit KhtT
VKAVAIHPNGTQIVAGAADKSIKLFNVADGKTLRDLDLRRRTSASVIALVRDGQPQTNPEPDAPLAAGDTLAELARFVGATP